MTFEHLEVLVEELSAEAALRALLPRVLGPRTFNIYPSQGKVDLLSNLEPRLRGYARWLPDTWRVLVIVDRDDEDCLELKARIETAARRAGLRTRSDDSATFQIVNRIAVEELEAWYFGDWTAVRQAYPRAARNVPRQARYRDPDAITGGTWEAFERELQRAGYFSGGLRKIEAAQQIAPRMEWARNTSPSFRALHAALVERSSRQRAPETGSHVSTSGSRGISRSVSFKPRTAAGSRARARQAPRRGRRSAHPTRSRPAPALRRPRARSRTAPPRRRQRRRRR
ncbi:MAG: DUF4276 family protein [Deltaproteobacteria bacterium]|nr:DUF4276 family protein [Deltaproteobacteria bacterium]